MQAILNGRVVAARSRPRSHRDFPLRGFVCCDACGRPLTGSWSKGRAGGRYAYYHCQRQCREVNVGKAALESQFVELLSELQPSPGFMRLVKEHILGSWRALRDESRSAAVAAERRIRAIQERLDRLDDAFLFAHSIDQETYERQRNKCARTSRSRASIGTRPPRGTRRRRYSRVRGGGAAERGETVDARFAGPATASATGVFPGRDPYGGKRFNRTDVTIRFFSTLPSAARRKFKSGGRGWNRTTDPSRVKRMLYR